MTKKKANARTAAKREPAPEGSDHEIDHLKEFMLAALQGRQTPDVPKKRIAPGTALPLKLTDQERELILKRSFAPDDLTRRLRIVPPSGKLAIVTYTLDDLDELAGYVAAEANHAKDRKLEKEWDKIFAKIGAILEAYTDE